MKILQFVLSVYLLGISVVNSQSLEIHQISVGQGDAALIVVRDTAKLRQVLIANALPIPADKSEMLVSALEKVADLKGTVKKAFLIDAGKGVKQGDKIYSYMKKIGVSTLDNIGLSHYHDDHFGGFKKIIDGHKIKPTMAYDRGYDDKKPKPNSKTNSGYINILGKYSIPRTTARSSSTNILFDKIGTNEIRITCIGNAGYVLGEAQTGDLGIASYDENDFSVTWLIQYGAFRFYTGGDLNGFDDGGKNDLESRVVDALKKFDSSDFREFTAPDSKITPGHVCGLKLNHHGGEESNNQYFLAGLKPKTIFISCGYEKGYAHPRMAVIKDIDPVFSKTWDIGSYIRPKPDSIINKTVQYYFMTSLMQIELADASNQPLHDNLGDTTKTKGIIGGDLVMIVDDANIKSESKYLTYWNGEKSTEVNTGPLRKPRPAKGFIHTKCHRATKLEYITNH